MAREIERKFLVVSDEYKKGSTGILYRQGYLSRSPDCTVRVRTAGDKAWLTIKGRSEGASRSEFEYQIPYEDAVSLFSLCRSRLIEKIRYLVPYEGMIWEVDEFLGNNHGLVIAEIELDYEDQPFKIPHWAGREVTGDPRYYNSNLVDGPVREK